MTFFPFISIIVSNHTTLPRAVGTEMRKYGQSRVVITVENWMDRIYELCMQDNTISQLWNHSLWIQQGLRYHQQRMLTPQYYREKRIFTKVFTKRFRHLSYCHFLKKDTNRDYYCCFKSVHPAYEEEHSCFSQTFFFFTSHQFIRKIYPFFSQWFALYTDYLWSFSLKVYAGNDSMRASTMKWNNKARGQTDKTLS